MATRPPILPRVHRAGMPFVLASFALAILCLVLSLETLGWLLLALTLYILYFFRDPARTTPLHEAALVSPADGIVTRIDEVVPPEELEMGTTPRTRISIFLSVFDVHVNRAPCDGRVERLVYVPGRFLNATLDKASEENERQLIRLVRDDGGDLAVVQIAGLIARRIVCDLREGGRVEAGARIGIIRFGSRVDVYCPPGMAPMVLEGQRMVGGETVIAAAAPLAAPETGRRC
ncbi:MAG: phosphatidylserine decarboxylase [Alphaproteobacteria bacterium]|nr:MAG: phosphatidylserine decarboxylase [Alphaproteobacteria bacterium]